jgi:acetyl esterase/lipase
MLPCVTLCAYVRGFLSRRHVYICPMAFRTIDLLNKTVSLKGLRVTRSLPYGDDARQVLDIYAPAAAKGAPVMVFYYGGSWNSGSRLDYTFIGALFAQLGFVTIIPDYRVYPQVRFPGFIDDCAAALAYVGVRVARHGGNPGQIFLMGHSAGAYNAVMTALAPGAPPLAGVIGLAGPYDFLPIRDPLIKEIFQTEDMAATQPINYARAGAPPMYLAHGGRDRTVLPRNTTALAARLAGLGSPAMAKIYPSLGHISLLLTLLPIFGWRAPLMADLAAFIQVCGRQPTRLAHSATASSVLRAS